MEPNVPDENEASGDSPESDEASTSDASASQVEGEERPPEPRRFLAGATEAPKAPSLPHWMRIFFLLLALAVSLTILLSLLTWPVKSGDSKPLLVCVSVTDYAAPNIPQLAFSEQDAARVHRATETTMRTAEFADGVIEAQSTEEFRYLFENRLRTIATETCVIYVHAHGVVAKNEQAYLLPAQISSDHPEYGYPVRDLLTAMANCKVTNKLLILDAVHFEKDLKLGVARNDFVNKLESEFQRIKELKVYEESNGSLWVLCSSGPGQSTMSSPALQGSPFAMAVAYCLLGGPDVDRSSKTPDGQKEPDGQVDAQELVDFVTSSVGNWSQENRHALQSPVAFHLGQHKDFSLATTDDSVTVESLLADSSNAGEQSSSSEDPGEGDAKPADGTVAGTNEEGLATTESEDNSSGDSLQEQVTQRLEELWQKREELANSQEVSLRPMHWNAFQQSLLRAEDNLLLGNPAIARRIIDEDIAILLEALVPDPDEIKPQWSLGFANDRQDDQPLQAEKTLVDLVLAEPTDANLKQLEGLVSVEASSLRVLGRYFRSEQKWIDADVVSMAIETRTLAHQVLSADRPEILDFVRGRIGKGDSLRRQADVELILGEVESARSHLQAARIEYRQADIEIRTAAGQLNKVQQVVTSLPYLIEWLGMRPRETVNTDRDERLLADFVRSLAAFIKSMYPQRRSSVNLDPLHHQSRLSALQTLADLAGELEAIAHRYAIESLQPTNWLRSRSVLRIPLIEPNLRRELYDHLVSINDARDLNSGGGNWRAGLASESRIGFPITDLFEIFAQATAQDATLNEASAFWERISELRRGPVSEASGDDWWMQRFRLLASAYWGGNLSINLEARDRFSGRLHREKLHEYLVWELARLQLDDSWLPGSPLVSQIQLVSDLARRDDKRFVPSNRQTFHLISSDRITLVAGQAQSFNLVFKATRDLPDYEKARLIIEQPTASGGLQFLHDQAIEWGERLEIPLERKVGREYSARITAISTSMDEHFPDMNVWARVETLPAIVEETELDEMTTGYVQVTGIDWFELQIEVKSAKPKPAELVFQWEDQGAQSGRVDLYPNQSLPVRIGVRIKVAEALPLRVELVAGASSQMLSVGDERDESGVVYLTPDKGFQLPIDGDALVARLYQDETLLDEESLEIAVLDLNQCFDRRVTLDPLDQTISARINRIHRSDVEAPVDFSLELLNHVAEDGVTSVTLKPDEAEGLLELRLPADAGVPHRLVIAGSGVPRLFRYRFGQEQVTAKVENQLELNVQAPVARTKIKFEEGPVNLPVAIQLDGPRVIRYDVGIDHDRNGVLEATERQRRANAWHGRDSRLHLIATTEPPGFSVDSEVTDLLVPLDMTGLVGAEPIIVQAVTTNRKAIARIPLYMLQALPRVTIGPPVPDAPIPLGGPFGVKLHGDRELFGAIDRLEFGFDTNGNGELDKEELISPDEVSLDEPIRFSESPWLTVSLPTEKLSAGAYVLLVRASSEVIDPQAEGEPTTLVSELARQKFTFVSTGRIAGVVRTADGLPAKNVVVAVADVGKTLSDANGRFSFANVPAGEFEVIAETAQRIGRRAVKVEPGQAGVAEITIMVK